MVDSKGRVKVGAARALVCRSMGVTRSVDFGLARQKQTENSVMSSVVGTLSYSRWVGLRRGVLTVTRSPELIQHQPYTEKADVWSLGVILYQMVTRKHPFTDDNPLLTARRIVEGSYPPLPDSVPDDVKKMVSFILQPDPAKRPDIVEVLQALPNSTSMLESFYLSRQEAVEQAEQLKLRLRRLEQQAEKQNAHRCPCRHHGYRFDRKQIPRACRIAAEDDFAGPAPSVSRRPRALVAAARNVCRAADVFACNPPAVIPRARCCTSCTRLCLRRSSRRISPDVRVLQSVPPWIGLRGCCFRPRRLGPSRRPSSRCSPSPSTQLTLLQLLTDSPDPVPLDFGPGQVHCGHTSAMLTVHQSGDLSYADMRRLVDDVLTSSGAYDPN